MLACRERTEHPLSLLCWVTGTVWEFLYTREADPSGLRKWWQWLQEERQAGCLQKVVQNYGWTLTGLLQACNFQAASTWSVKRSRSEDTTDFRLLSASWNPPCPRGSRQPLHVSVQLPGVTSCSAVWCSAEIPSSITGEITSAGRSPAGPTYRWQGACLILRSGSTAGVVTVTDFPPPPAAGWVAQTCADGRKALPVALLTTISAHHFIGNKHLLALWQLLQGITSKQWEMKRRCPPCHSLAPG